jgi:tetratricopeptide (TPR) repeat protein
MKANISSISNSNNELPALNNIDINNIQIRNGLGNLNNKLKSAVCKIAYMGASVTVQKQGYRPFLHQWIQDYFQQPHIEINGSFGGMVSAAGVFLMNDTVIPYKPDICFIDHSTVDMSWNNPEISPSIEVIVRKLKAIDCQVCFLYLYRSDQVFDLSNPVISMYEEIAEFYDLPSINVGRYIEACLRENKIVFENLFRDSIHNNLQGGQFVAKYILNSLKKILSESTNEPKEFNNYEQYLYSDVCASEKIVPISNSMIRDQDNYKVGYFNDERLNKEYKYYQIDSSNEIEFIIKGKLIGITAIIGRESGIIELTTPKRTWEYEFWDKYCHYDRFHTKICRHSFETETNVSLKISNKPIDYSVCRRTIENPETIEKQFKIIGLFVYGQVTAPTRTISRKNMLQKAKMYCTKGAELQKQGNLEESIKSYQQAIKIKSDYAQPLLNLGKVYASQENWSESAKCYQHIIGLNSDNSYAYIGLARALLKQNKTYGAIAAYAEAIELKSDLPARVYKDYGDLLIKVNRTNPDAIAAYQKAAEIKQDWGANFYNKLASLFEQQGNLGEATTYYLKALSLSGSNPKLYLNVGNIYFKQGLLNEAAGNYQRALELKPDFSNVYKRLGDLLKQKNQLNDAVKCYLKALEIQPDFKNAYRSLGDVLMEQGKHSEAQQSYQRAN